MSWITTTLAGRNGHQEPYDLFEHLLYVKVRFFYRINCIDIFLSDFRPTPLAWLPCYVGSIYAVLTVYTIATYNFDVSLQCLTFTGMSFQGITKNFTVNHGLRAYRRMFRFLGNVYTATGRTAHHISLMRTAANVTTLACNGCLALFTLTALAIVSIPVLGYAFNGRAGFMISAFVPGIDETSRIGFAMTTGMHVLFLFFGYTGTCASDMTCLMMVLHVWPLSVLLARAVNDLNGTLLMERSGGGGGGDCVTADSLRLLVRMQLRNVLQMHKEFRRYMDDVSGVHYYWFTVEIYTNALSLVLLIFGMMSMDDYVVGYFFFVAIFGKLLIYCVYGTFVELLNDQIYVTINAIEWYHLPISMQREVGVALALAQRPKLLMAGVVPLNMNLFVGIMKTIYSTTMLLMETL